MDSDTLKTVTGFLPVAVPFINLVIETRVKPILQELFKGRESDRSFSEGVTKFSEYLNRAYQKNSYLTVLVFPNRPKELRKLYVPLTLVGQHTVGRLSEEAGVRRFVFSNDLVIDSDADDFLPSYRKILINDTAGMGKSTLLKFLFLQCIDKNFAIPVLIELRRITPENTILKLIRDDLNAIDEGFDEDFILKLLRRGDFVFLFDGFDEIPLANRDFVTTHLQTFVSKTASNYFVMTSRPDPALASFSDFVGFKVKPFTRLEAYELIRRYDEEGGRAEQLVQDLDSDRGLDEFEVLLSNPLLVSLLYAYYEYTPDLSVKKQPFKKHLFYRQIYDALFYRHDLSKPGAHVREKRTQLGLDDFEKLLRALAYLTFKSGEIEYDTDTILSRMTQLKKLCPDISFSESDLLEDVVLNVPVFIREGIYYKWQHKSLQEYFAARFILKDVEQDTAILLTRIYRSPELERCYNLLGLLYDMDASLFRRTLGREVAREFISYCSAQVRDNEHSLPTDETLLRRELSFLGSVFFLFTSAHSSKRISAQMVEELRRGNLRWSAGEYPNIFEEVLNNSEADPSQMKFSVVSIGQKHLQSAVLLSQPSYTIFSILAERKDGLIKKIDCAPGPALELSLDRHFAGDLLYGTAGYPEGSNYSPEQLEAANQIMIIALRDYIHDAVFSLEACLKLLEQPMTSAQAADSLYEGW